MSSRDEIYGEVGLSYPYNEYGGRKMSLVDLNLISGSSDLLRNSIGGYFFNEFDEYGQLVVPPTFKTMQPTSNLNPLIHSIASYAGPSINAAVFEAETGTSPTGEDSDEDDGYYARGQNSILPFVKFVCHLEADSAREIFSNPSTGNKYWECMFTDQEFNNSTVPKIYSNSVYDEHYTIINLPYDNMQKNIFSDGASVRSLSTISYDYNRYDKEYQQTIDFFESEKQEPNWYIINLLSTASETEGPNKILQQKTIDYYSNGSVSNLISTAKSINQPDTDSNDDGQPDTSSGDGLKLLMSNMNDSDILLRQEISQQQSNLIFNSFATQLFLKPNSMANAASNLIPFYNKIKFTSEKGKRYVKSIKENKYSTTFMRTLKEAFLEQTNDELPLDTTQFLVNERYLSSSIETRYDVGQTNSETTAYRGVDFVELLLYSHNKIKNENNDFTVIDNNNIEVKSATDDVGSYRAFNVRNSLRIINDTISNFCKDSNAFYISDINSLLNLQNQTIDGGASDYGNFQPNPSYNEVVAYRVEKIAGAVSGDSNTQNVIQNFWIFNDDDLEELQMIDSQVKYGTDYTYRIHAYYLVQGVKYEFSNLQLTKIIGTVRDGIGYSSDTDISSGIDSGTVAEDNPITAYCVEYFNPETGETVKDLLEDHIGDLDLATVSSLSQDDTLRIRKSSISGPGPMPPYFANFAVTVQPSLKLIEVPVHTKQITISDYIPNKVNVNPAYSLGNDNKLIFNLRYQPFESETYPPLVQSSEEGFRSKYLMSNDLSVLGDLQKETVSYPRYVDVYRISEKPKSFLDFEAGYLSTIDNRIQDKNFAYTTSVFYDTVKSNTTYYYLFKTRNDLNIPGRNSQIIEAELVNDGGYKYALFDVMNEEEMIVENFKNISETFKKILEITPNPNQIIFDDSEVDYTQTAASQYDKVKIGKADELIWNKTFKMRLTSKKTGKKIDLNITYNDPSVKLENN
tara:strand:- start:6876 stop:9779 length:2904 start_codon:yes stop_codon:yes gene_type:complete